MGRAPCCDKDGVKKGAWSPEEDRILIQYIQKHGHGSWRSLPKNAGNDLCLGLLRCGKSCRLRWINYLRPDIKRGPFAPEEEATIIRLHGVLGNKWAAIASHLPGRTDNEIKNFWNTHLRKRLNLQIQQSCSSSEPISMKCGSPTTRHMVQWESARVEAEARLSMETLIDYSSSSVKFEGDYYLQLWNSEIGESFRDIKGKDVGAAESPISQTSSSTKFGCGSVDNEKKVQMLSMKSTKTSTSNDTTQEQEEDCKPNIAIVTGSDSINSNEFSDSSNTALKLLLDIPGGNDMEFFEEQTENFSSFLNLKCD